MTMLAYDDVWLREPRLMVPKRKPICGVKIDIQSTYGRFCELAYAPTIQPNVVILRTGPTIVVNDGITFIQGDPSYGRCVVTRGPESLGPIKCRALGEENFLILVTSKSSDNATTSCAIGNYGASAANGWMFRVPNTAVGARFYGASGTINADHATLTSAWVTSYAYRSGSEITCGIIGVGSTTDTTIAGLSQENTEIFNGMSTVRGTLGDISMVIFMIGLPNPVAALTDLNNNPYQFLIPV